MITEGAALAPYCDMRNLTPIFAITLLTLNSGLATAMSCKDQISQTGVAAYQSLKTEVAGSQTLHSLMIQATTPGALQAQARKELQSALKLDDMNFDYFRILFEKDLKAEKLMLVKIFPSTDGALIAYPYGTSAVPKNLVSQFRKVDYKQWKKENMARYAKDVEVTDESMQAGTGSSLTRKTFMEKVRPLLGIAPGAEIVLGAKGTDLLATIPHPLKANTKVQVTLVELKLIRAILTAKGGDYANLNIRDIVGPETKNRMSELWNKKSLLNPELTYAEEFAKTSGLTRGKLIFQSHVATLHNGQITTDHVSPPGHGVFAVNAIREVVRTELTKSSKDHVIAISNGEDLNSVVDPILVGGVIKESFPISLITTDKVSTDKKGGLLAVVRDTRINETYLKVIDTAEAKEAGQLETFEKAEGIVSTNLTLFNAKALKEALKGFTEAELELAMAPDVLRNAKVKEDSNGVKKEFVQLEGTIGTVIMNLDRAYRKKHNGKQLVHIINFDSKERTSVFSPIKSAFDYFLQFNSDRFVFDPKTYKLVHQNDQLLSHNLLDPKTGHKFYQDVETVRYYFHNTSVRDLKDLQVNGQVSLRNMILKGRVVISNETETLFDINSLAKRLMKSTDGRLILENINIKITASGVQISWLGIGHARVALAGSHTDYNGGWTLAKLLPAKTTTTTALRSDFQIHVESQGKETQFVLGDEKLTGEWHDYVKGATAILIREGFQISGANLKLTSDIPYGGGVSSSAAMVTSIFKSFRGAFKLPISDMKIAEMGQKVEHFLGAKTGLLDQMTISLLAEDSNSALFVNFSNMSFKKFTIPENAEFVTIQSGLTHSLRDTEGNRNYTTRRNECESACQKLNIKNLSQLTLADLEKQKAKLTNTEYIRARHIISENERVLRFVESAEAENLKEMGKVMNESHESQKSDYDISEDPINLLVKISRSNPRVYGAQLTGGGFGGGIVILTNKGEGKKIAEQIAEKYLEHPTNKGQFQPTVISAEQNSN